MLDKSHILHNLVAGKSIVSNTTSTFLSSTETSTGLSIVNSTGGTSIGPKNTLVVNAANALRYNFLSDGTPLGISIEPSVAYLNGYSQPTVAQTTTASGMSNATTPTRSVAAKQQIARRRLNIWRCALFSSSFGAGTFSAANREKLTNRSMEGGRITTE